MGLLKEGLFLRIDGATGSMQRTHLKRSSNCLLHHPINTQILKIPISNENTIEQLLSHLAEDEDPMLWEEKIVENLCFYCNTQLSNEAASLENLICPNCKKEFISTPKRSLRQFPKNTILKDLEIPKNEILVVRNQHGIKYIELTK